MKRLAIIAGCFLATSSVQATYSGYTYQRTLTIAHAQVPNSDQTNFPVLISTNDVTLSTGTGGHLSNSSGYDLIFSTMSDCSYLLHWDTETVNNTGTATLNVWVNVPTVKTASDTTLYLCYGNSSITTYQGASASTWDSNYKGVWHMQETGTGAAGDYKDSTSNGNNSSNTTNQPSKTTSGIIAGAESFNGSTSQITVPSTLSGLTSFTISGWIKQSSSGGLYDSWFCNASYYGTNQVARQYGNGWQAYPTGGNGKVSGSGLTDDSWNYIVLTYVSGGTNGVIFYINGSAQASVATYTGAVASHSNDAMGTDGSNYAKAIMEEFRVSGSVRSADWITTEYNNQSAPSTFTTIGTETTSGGAVTGNAFWFGEF